MAGLEANAVSAGPGCRPQPAEAEAAVAPAEPPPEPVRVFVGKQRRGVPWGPFQIAPGVPHRLGCDLQPSQRSLWRHNSMQKGYHLETRARH